MSDPAEPRRGFFSKWTEGRRGVAAGLLGIMVGAGLMALASAQGVVDPRRVEVETIVREYLLANPEILEEASLVLHQRQLSAAVNANRAGIETPYGSAWAGNKDGDVVLVEFFDYACPFCHQSVKDIDRLLSEDKKLKVVWRDWPVLGDDSVVAAEVSLAAAQQGKFHDFYRSLFSNGRPTPDALARARAAAGLAPADARFNYRGEIEKNYELARAISATGTPVFVIGDKVLQGAVGYDALKKAIAEARAANAS